MASRKTKLSLAPMRKWPPPRPWMQITTIDLHTGGEPFRVITKVALETGLIPMRPPETTVRIDSPAGLITAHARVSGGEVTSVNFHLLCGNRPVRRPARI